MGGRGTGSGGAGGSKKKPEFGGSERFAIKNDPYDNDSSYITFDYWSKFDQQRIYMNDYKNRTIGYIDEKGNVTIQNNQGMDTSEINTAIKGFKSKYSMKTTPIDISTKKFSEREIDRMSREQMQKVGKHVVNEIATRMKEQGKSSEQIEASRKKNNMFVETADKDRLRGMLMKRRWNGRRY